MANVEKKCEVDEKMKKKNDEIEEQKLGLMRASVEKQDPTSKEVDDLMLRRFLPAHTSDVEKASDKFLKYLKWRRTYLPNGFISEVDIKNGIAQKKAFVQGFDKKGHPILIFLSGKHFPNKEKGSQDDFKKFMVYSLEKLIARMPAGDEKFVAIADAEGWGYANCDIRGGLEVISILQDFYPEKLAKLFIVHVPYAFMTAWKLIYPLIRSNTRKKMMFVGNKKLKSTLLQDIDESQLPEIYGGKLPLVPIEQS